MILFHSTTHVTITTTYHITTILFLLLLQLQTFYSSAIVNLPPNFNKATLKPFSSIDNVPVCLLVPFRSIPYVASPK